MFRTYRAEARPIDFTIECGHKWPLYHNVDEAFLLPASRMAEEVCDGAILVRCSRIAPLLIPCLND